MLLLSVERHFSPHHNQTVMQCNKFMDFFTSKIHNIRASLSLANSCVPSNDISPTTQHLSHFSPTVQQEVEKIISKFKPSTCSLDPFPYPLLKAHCHSISQLITNTINPLGAKVALLRQAALLNKTALTFKTTAFCCYCLVPLDSEHVQLQC